MPLPESELLKQRNPALKNENDWEEFQLSNVEVRDPKDSRLVSLLHADAVYPVLVQGRLEPVARAQARLLRKPLPRALQIEVPNVTRFAYGQYDDGEMAIWAAGRAGWFKITPARSYKDIYAGMVTAIKLLYFAADMYRGSTKSKGNKSANDIFEAYVKENPGEYANAGEVAEAAHEHRDFLLLSMLRGNELDKPDWKTTNLFLHLKEAFPDAHEAMLKKKEGKAGRRKAKASSRQASQVASQEPETADDGARKPGRSKAGTSTSAGATTANGAPKKDDNWWEAKVIWEMMQKAQVQGIVAPSNMSIDTFAKIMVRKYEVDDETLAGNYIRAHAQNLMYMMSHKRRPAVEWVEQPIYTELAAARLSPSLLKSVSDLEIRQRKVPLPDPEPLAVSGVGVGGLESSSDEDIQAIRRRSRKGRSSLLRPKSSKFSSKGMTRSGKSYHRSSGDEDDDTDVPDVASPPKRKSSASEAELGGPRRKRTTSRSHQQTAPRSPGGAGESGEEDERERAARDLPLRWKTPVSRIGTPGSNFGGGTGGSSLWAPRIMAAMGETPARALSREANSPGDVWKCGVDGCVVKVYGASSEQSQVAIAEHLDGHDERRKERVDLAREVELESHLPVSNLIKRIREMADAQQTAVQMGLATGPSGPQPIRRLY